LDRRGISIPVVDGACRRIASPDRLRTLARIQDASRWIIQGLIVLAAVASLAAVIALLKKADGETAPMLAARIALAGGVVVLSWMLIHTVFAVHYAHAFYGDGPAPGRTMPAGCSSRAMNRSRFLGLLLFLAGARDDLPGLGCADHREAHAAPRLGARALSFFFNTVILALTINLLVSAFQ